MRTFSEALRAHGLPEYDVPPDGEMHRFGEARKSWAVNYGSYGAFGEWGRPDIPETGIKWSMRDDDINPDEWRSIQAQITREKEQWQINRQKKAEQAAVKARTLWDNLSETGNSPYLERKQINAFGLRFTSDAIALPICDVNGKLWSLQHIFHDGSKRFLSGGRKKACFHVIGALEESDIICIGEGYATMASIHMAVALPSIVGFDSGNLLPVTEVIRKKYPNKQILLIADNDCWKPESGNPGREKAEEAAKRFNCKVLLPVFAESSLVHKPTDFNDLHCLEGLEAVRNQLQDKPSSPKTVLPFGFTLQKAGLYFDTGKDDGPEWICSPLEVLAYTRNEHNENWGRLVRFQDLDGHTHERAIPMELLSGDCSELYGLLLSLGLRLTTKKSIRNRLTEYLQGITLSKRATCTSRIGWYGNHFILPDGAIPATDEIYLQSENSNFTGFRNAGTLEEWQAHIAVPCQGNSRLIFALSCAFAAPLLPLVHAESGGFNLKGSSSIGKSTALAVAASVWGSPKYIQQWKATGNALEAVSEAHNNTLLCLDELGQVDGREAGEVAYMLANGSGKNRLKAKGGLRRKFEWNLLFLSTGEISIADKINEAGKKAQAGMLARMADIPADAEKGFRLFDTVHGFKDGNAMAHHLKESTGKYYGTAIRAFLPHLVNIKDQLPQALKQIQGDFFTQYVRDDADGQVRRVAYRFVLVAAAGELAIKLGILPYETGEAFNAVGICFQAWLGGRGSAGAYEAEEAVRQVRAFFEAHHSSRFTSMTEGTSNSERTINEAGYKRLTYEGRYEFFVHPQIFDREICKGFDPLLIKRELAGQGLLVRDSDNKYTRPIRVPNLGGQKRMVHIAPGILMEDEA